MSFPNNYAKGSIGGKSGGSNNPNGDVKYTYLGFTQTKNSDNLITQVTYQGTKQGLQQERDKLPSAGGTWYIGYQHSEYGRLQSVDITQEAGPFWHATVSYNKALTLGISVNIGGDGQPQESTLDISMMSLPLQKSIHYDYRWNHSLLATTSGVVTSTTQPGQYTQLAGFIHSLTNPYTQQPLQFNDRWDQKIAWMIYNGGKGGQYAKSLDILWVDDPTLTPDRGVADWSQQNNIGKPKPKNLKWNVVYFPTKPGVDHWDVPVFTITESGKYNSRLSCAWAMKAAGKLAYPTLGDYGIQMYNNPSLATAALTSVPSCYWLCEGGTVEYDGKHYNATCKFTYSPNAKGWDRDLYTIKGGWGEYLSASQRNPDPVVRRSDNNSPGIDMP